MSRAESLVVVQARVGSTRLPGKVLMDLAGEPLIVRVVERVARMQTPVRIVVATTTDPADDGLVSVCRAAGIEVFRGHPTDLLDRHLKVACHYGAEVVAKVPSDCPLVDPAVIDAVFARFAEGDSDYTSNLHPASFPDGNDAEIMSVEVLIGLARSPVGFRARAHDAVHLGAARAFPVEQRRVGGAGQRPPRQGLFDVAPLDYRLSRGL